MPKLTVELSLEQYEELEAHATAHQISLGEVVRRALDQFLAAQRSLTEDLGETEMLVTSEHIIHPDEYMNMGLKRP